MSKTKKGIGIKELFKIFWETDSDEIDTLEIENEKDLEKFDIDEKVSGELIKSKKKIKQLEEKYAINEKPTKVKKGNVIKNENNINQVKRPISQKEKDEDELIR